MGRGGRIIQVGQDLVVTKTLPSELDGSETTELKDKNVRFEVTVVYNLPNGNKQDFLVELHFVLSSFRSASMPAIFCDFNNDVIRKNQLEGQYSNFHASMDLSK